MASSAAQSGALGEGQVCKSAPGGFNEKDPWSATFRVLAQD